MLIKYLKIFIEIITKVFQIPGTEFEIGQYMLNKIKTWVIFSTCKPQLSRTSRIEILGYSCLIHIL